MTERNHGGIDRESLDATFLSIAGDSDGRLTPDQEFETAMTLTDEWAERRFVLCFRDEAALSPASRLLVQHLTNGRGA
jgi:hypothetical protein